MILHDHSPMGFSGHFVALFRQPEQRLLSAWYDDEDLFRAEPTIPRCVPNRMAVRYLTMEEFIEKSLGFLLSVYSPTSPFACVTHNMELMSTVPRVLTVKLNLSVSAIAGLAGIHLPDFPCGLWSRDRLM